MLNLQDISVGWPWLLSGSFFVGTLSKTGGTMSKDLSDHYLDRIAEFAVTGKGKRKSTRPVRSAWLDRLSQSQGQR